MSRWRPGPLALSAGLLVLLFGALHLAGLRDWVSVLTATPVEGVSLASAAVGGSAYVLAWFGAVLVAPVLLLSALFRAALKAAAARYSASSSAASSSASAPSSPSSPTSASSSAAR